MKPIEIPDFEDNRIFIPFTLPVRGRKPIVFKVPRRDFIPPEEAKLMAWLLAELDVDEDKVAELVDPNEPAALEKAVYLLALKPYVTDAQFKTLKTAAFGQVRFIMDRWNEQSRVTLGEYWASANSSTENTRGRSTPTSKPDSDTPDGTSDDDSDGAISGTS